MVQMLTTCLNLALVPFYLYVLRQGQVAQGLASRGLFWAALSVVFAALGGLLNLTALSRMEAGTVTAIVAASPAVTMLVLILTGQEGMSWTKGLGVSLVILGVVALTR
jgi:drug/metabolite transporter (DMT)-like permease